MCYNKRARNRPFIFCTKGKHVMKVAIIGSRNITISDFWPYIPAETQEIVSGGARGIDSCARRFARQNNLKLTEFLPEYEKYAKGAPLKRNDLIVDYADLVVAFWDGKSRGTKYVIERCKKVGKEIKIYMKKSEAN